MESYQNCSALLCMTVVHNDTHTSVGLGLVFVVV